MWQTLILWGFKWSLMDHSLFYFTTNANMIWLLVYVDDIIITRSKTSLIDLFVQKFNAKFSLKDLGHVSYFLGIETFFESFGLYLSQI